MDLVCIGFLFCSILDSRIWYWGAQHPHHWTSMYICNMLIVYMFFFLAEYCIDVQKPFILQGDYFHLKLIYFLWKRCSKAIYFVWRLFPFEIDLFLWFVLTFKNPDTLLPAPKFIHYFYVKLWLMYKLTQHTQLPMADSHGSTEIQ